MPGQVVVGRCEAELVHILGLLVKKPRTFSPTWSGVRSPKKRG